MSNAVKFRGQLTLNGLVIRCPGRGPGNVPRELTLMASGPAVMATCGEKHRSADGGRTRAQCFFPVQGITPATLATLSKAQPGNIKATLPDGKVLEGRLAETKTAVSSGTAAAAMAAAQHKNGTAKAGPARVPSGSGAAQAAFMAVAAIANMGTAAANAVGNTAMAAGGAVGKVADMGREGIGAARDGIQAADNFGERRHQRRMRGGSDNDSD